MRSRLTFLLFILMSLVAATAMLAEETAIRRIGGDKRAAAAPPVPRTRKQLGSEAAAATPSDHRPVRTGPPVEMRMTKAHGRKFDVRSLPQTPPVRRERPEREPPPMTPRPLEGPGVL